MYCKYVHHVTDISAHPFYFASAVCPYADYGDNMAAGKAAGRPLPAQLYRRGMILF